MAVMCNICEKIFSSQSNLNRHSKNVHYIINNAMSYDKSLFNYKCLEELCNHSFRYNLDLIKHLKSEHLFNIEDEEIKMFANLDDFRVWKMQIENTEKCNYVITRGTQKLSTGDEKTYYVCNRSGRYTKNVVKKATKSQGTCKLNRACISQMNVTKQSNGSILVERQKSHYGHSIDIQHLRISKEDRNIIANKLLEGVPKTRILDSFRTKIGTDLKRVDLVTVKDIENVERDFKLCVEKGVKHKEDAVSIDLWVHENSQAEDNQVLYYKRQGENKDPFEANDFCLILMNPYQQLMLTTFGQTIIAIDSTHGLNQYDFELTTVMVVDDYGEGCAVAYMFTNRKDTFVNTIFFDAIKAKVGILKTKTFMSDISEVFYNAWTSVMGRAEHQLYCSWHVDRAWQTNLTKINNKEKRSWVYKTIKVLQQNIDSESFVEQLNTTIVSLLTDSDTNKFGVYFEEYYSKNSEKWAYCFRKDCGINTNMILESMHKTIKYIYLNRKTVKRLDKGLHAVLQYTRNKMVDRLMKQVKGKNTARKRDITKRHRTAMTLNSSHFEVFNTSQNKWKLSHETKSYHVEKVLDRKCCQIECSFCNICIHMYKCSCSDFFIRATICKHIHFVCINFENQLEVGGSYSVSEEVKNNIQICLSQLNSKMNNRSDIKEKLVNELSALNVKIATTDVANVNEEVLSQMLSHIRNASNLLDLKKVESDRFVPTLEESSTKHIRKQLSFHSTKRKRSIKEREKNPNQTEINIINDLLSGNKVEFISNDSNNDHKYI